MGKRGEDSGKISRHQIDHLNAAMTAASAGPNRDEAMLAVLRSKECYLVACGSALRFIPTGAGVDRVDAAHDLAVSVLISMYRNPGLFRGASLFSTFLVGALKRANSKTLAEKIPSAIRRIHPLAPLVFELMTRDGWRDEEIRAQLSSFMPHREAEEVLSAMRDELARDPEYYGSRFGGASFSDLSGESDEEPRFENRFEDEKAEDPLENLMDEHRRQVFKALLDRLDPSERSLVEEYVLSRRIKTYKEAEEKLGLDDAAYELKKIREKLKAGKRIYE